jgi:anti-sigma factor RsiW
MRRLRDDRDKGIMTELSCMEVRDLLGASMDGELADAGEVRRHLETCDACRNEFDRLAMLRARIRAAGPHALPERLEQSLRWALDSQSRHPPDATAGRRWWRRGFLAASHLLVAVLSALLAILVMRWRDTADAARHEVVAAHIRAALANELVQVASADTHTVKPWLAARVPFSPDVRDHKADGFPLIGGRVERIAGRPAAVIVYGRRQHLISVFVLPAEEARGIVGQSELWRGYHVVTWRDVHFAYLATSDLNRPELETFVALAGRDLKR